MAYRSCLILLIVCFLLGSCGGGDRHRGPVFVLKNPTFTSPDGSDITGKVPTPDGKTARFSFPSGKNFASATLKEVDTEKPLKVSVNKWINKLRQTNAVQYVDPDLQVTPVLDEQGQFDMTATDISMVNEQLKKRGFNLKVLSSEKGLDCSKTGS